MSKFMSKIELKKVLGNNIRDFANNIDENFNRISENGIWRGEKGEGYAEKTIPLWEMKNGSINILNENILKILFTESDGSYSSWEMIKSWATDDKDKFISLSIPMNWNMWPGFPLYYAQPVKCFKYFNVMGTGIDWSGMIAVVGDDEYRRYDILPRLYVDQVSGNYCWMINGMKTGIPASVNPDNETRNTRLYLIRNDGGVVKYMTVSDNATIWTDIPSALPRVGDFAWRLSTKNITSGGESKAAQVLEVCIYDGNEWNAATADDNNSNFFITYDDAVMTYIWQEIYGGLGDTYADAVSASSIHSFQFPVYDDNNNKVLGKTHKITSKSYKNGEYSDLIIEGAGGNNNIVLSNYKNVYLGTPGYNEDGNISYGDIFLETGCRVIGVEDMNSITESDINVSQMFCIDRCYWKGDKNLSTMQLAVDANGSTHYRGYVRYVFLKAYKTREGITWDSHGIGLAMTDNVDSTCAFEVGFTADVSAEHRKNGGSLFNMTTHSVVPINWDKFGVITEMRDPVNGNYANFDFIHAGAFRYYHDNNFEITDLRPDLDDSIDYCEYRSQFANNTIVTNIPGYFGRKDNIFLGMGVNINNTGTDWKYGDHWVRNNKLSCGDDGMFMLVDITTGEGSICDNIVESSNGWIISGDIRNNNISNSSLKLDIRSLNRCNIRDSKFNNILYFKDTIRDNYDPANYNYVLGYLSGGKIMNTAPRVSETTIKYALSSGASKCFKRMAVSDCSFTNVNTRINNTLLIATPGAITDMDKSPMDLCLLGMTSECTGDQLTIDHFNIRGNILSKYYYSRKLIDTVTTKNYMFYIDASAAGQRNGFTKEQYGGLAVIGILNGGANQFTIPYELADRLITHTPGSGLSLGKNNGNYVIDKADFDTLDTDTGGVELSQLNVINNINYEDDEAVSVLNSDDNRIKLFSGDTVDNHDYTICIPLFIYNNRVACIQTHFGIHSMEHTRTMTAIVTS